MNEFFVIKLFKKLDVFYFYHCIGKELSSENCWQEATPYSATKFYTYAQALEQLKEGREKYNWGGIFQIEKIFVCR